MSAGPKKDLQATSGCNQNSSLSHKIAKPGQDSKSHHPFFRSLLETPCMRAQTKELWLELCQQAANEQDPNKFRAIFREIFHVLELKTGRLRQSSPRLASSESALIRCSLCNMPVPLESSKTDENGKAVHEECYMLRLRLEQATTPPKD